jgi:hypothetical protein
MWCFIAMAVAGGVDLDGDGWSTPDDCNDEARGIHPGAPEIVADAVDSDCDGRELCFLDADLDGVGGGSLIAVAVLDCDASAFDHASGSTGDCDDTDWRAVPGGEELPGDETDGDCDGFELCYVDRDGDGWGTGEPEPVQGRFCLPWQGHAPFEGDCDDDEPAAHRGAVEVCDGVDNDCNGRIDEVTDTSEARTWFVDRDGDGFGDATETLEACGRPVGFAEQAGDCDDSEPRTFPGAVEICDGLDNDCVGGVDDDPLDVRTWYADVDEDGAGDRHESVEGCEPPEGGTWVAAGGVVDLCPQDPYDRCAGCDGTGGLPAAWWVWLLPWCRVRSRDANRASHATQDCNKRLISRV